MPISCWVERYDLNARRELRHAERIRSVPIVLKSHGNRGQNDGANAKGFANPHSAPTAENEQLNST
jgi:hypothetical protein